LCSLAPLTLINFGSIVIFYYTFFEKHFLYSPLIRSFSPAGRRKKKKIPLPFGERNPPHPIPLLFGERKLGRGEKMVREMGEGLPHQSEEGWIRGINFQK